MSRASQLFLGVSLLISSATVYGVHWLQERESETMYQGVIRDEARVAAKIAALSSSSSSSVTTTPLPPSTSTASSTSTSPITQPAPYVDPECITCVISPPPQLVEAHSAEQRARDRDARWAEYTAQKRLGEWAASQERVGASSSSSASGMDRSTFTSDSSTSERLV